TIREFLLKHEIDVTLVVFDKSAFTISHQLLGAVESYIDEHYVSTHQILRRSRFEETELLYEEMHEAISVQGAFPSKDMFEKLEETFSEKLLRLIDEQGKTDVEVYKRANINRKLFSKIRTGKGYTPSKKTVLAFALALELSLDETDDLLECAGYALSHAVKFDVIVEYFIASARYDIFEVNEVLFKYDQPLLGG
ncbi:MAG: RNase III inhibitor, partial [Streptococcaceae bacterium]|nr:RNase III inhibitor [Streptococcaceae bacterium]